MVKKPAVVLVSGGLDSATCLAVARQQGYACHALTFDYGQRHRREIECAAAVARALEAVEHRIFRLDLRQFGGSALTTEMAVPRDRGDPAASGEIPVTYVPARNTIFLSLALAWAEVLGAVDIFIGVNAVDYSGYPDCRPEYIRAFERLARLATRAGVEGAAITIRTPLLDLPKAEIIRLGLSLGVDYSLTTSCYDPAQDGAACGRCDACIIRQRGFAEVGVADPIRYVQRLADGQ